MRRLPMLVPLFALVAAPTTGASQWPPESFENLRVLPDTISQQELIGLMAGFTRALGVRCNHCHVGEPRAPLSEYDFPSDDKVTKRKAREMLRMVNAINSEHLPSLDERADPPVRVQCITCHGGRTTPRLLEDVLTLAYDAGGLDSTLATYHSLRDRYYGQAAYDFGSVPLTTVAAEIQSRGSLPDAVTILELNVEMNPTSVFAKRQHGSTAVLQAFMDQGADAGIARYRELLEAYGQNAFPAFGLNGLGYQLLDAGRTGDAVAAFRMAVDTYPDNANLYDSLGEAYAADGDTTRAIENYERSLELNPQNANAERMLRELGADR